jgi:hypothetical protein
VANGRKGARDLSGTIGNSWQKAANSRKQTQGFREIPCLPAIRVLFFSAAVLAVFEERRVLSDQFDLTRLFYLVISLDPSAPEVLSAILGRHLRATT